jgi:hypothetical protein
LEVFFRYSSYTDRGSRPTRKALEADQRHSPNDNIVEYDYKDMRKLASVWNRTSAVIQLSPKASATEVSHPRSIPRL